MEFYQLEQFVAVAEEGGFTKAAERVFRSQAAVSVAIRKLEEDLGIALIRRDSHECELTEVGLVVLDHARQLIALRNEMQRTVADYTSLAKGRVRIAAHESAAQHLLPAPLASFHRLFPEVKIETRICDVGEIGTMVSDRRVDFGFGIRQASLKGLRSEVLLIDPLVLIAAPDSTLVSNQDLHVNHLGNEHFFVHHLQTQTTNDIQHLFDEHQTRFNVIAELWNFETVKQFVAAGSGVAIVPQSVVVGDLASGRLVRIAVAGLQLQRSLEVVYRDHGRLLPAAAELLNLLRSWPWNPESPKALDKPATAAPGT